MKPGAALKAGRNAAQARWKRRLRLRQATPLSRPDELAAIASYIEQHGISFVVFDRKGGTRLERVRP